MVYVVLPAGEAESSKHAARTGKSIDVGLSKVLSTPERIYQLAAALFEKVSRMQAMKHL